MRILCLHGQGTNAAIFRKQLSHVMAMLPEDFVAEFFDASHYCEPAPEVEDFFPPPYLAWYNTPTVAKVAEAHRQVRAICESKGPFDAVIGFSQGAAVAASMLLHSELNAEPPLFQAAIFIGSPLPFSSLLSAGLDVRRQFGLSESPPNPYARSSSMPDHLHTDPAYLRNPAQLGDIDQNCAGNSQYQMFHETADTTRIRVPTGHVYGRRDKWYYHSKDLVDLCCVEGRTQFEHDGGHEIPQAYTEELCDLIESTLARITLR